MSLLRDSAKVQKKDNQDINDAEGQYHGASIDESIALFCALVAREARTPDEFYWERWLEEQRKRR